MGLGSPTAAVRVVATALSLIILLWSFARQRTLLQAASIKRVAVSRSRLHIERYEMRQKEASAARPRLALELELGQRAEAARMRTLRELRDTLESMQQRAHEIRSSERIIFGSTDAAGPTGGPWHGVGGDGACPAAIPQWDWQLLREAAEAADGAARDTALATLAQQSGLGMGVLTDLAHRYAAKLAEPEFAGILDSAHPECNGTRFASLEGDRVLRIRCDDPHGATYALDDGAQLFSYHGPVRLADAESVMAFCGEESNLLSHPRFRPELVERARQGATSARRPSVLIFMIDATSRAHFRRSMPRTLAALQLIATYGARAAEVAASQTARSRRADTAAADGAATGDGLDDGMSAEGEGGGGASAGGGEGGEGGGGGGAIHVFDFERFNIVGYNSMPNQLPLFCGTTPDDLSGLSGDRWCAARRSDAHLDPTTSVCPPPARAPCLAHPAVARANPVSAVSGRCSREPAASQCSLRKSTTSAAPRRRR